MTPTDFRAWLSEEVRRNHSSIRAAARAWNVSHGYLSDVLRGEKEPGEAILREVGWRRVTTYERINDDGNDTL